MFVGCVGLPLYDETVGKLFEALSDIDKDLSYIRRKVEDVNVKYIGLDSNDTLHVQGVLSSDSSYIKKSFAYVTLYLIQAVGLKYCRSGGEPSTEFKVKADYVKHPHTRAELTPDHVVERIVKMRSRLYELLLLEDLLDGESGYIAMLDGSLISFLSFGLKGVKEKREEVRKLWEDIRDSLRRLSQSATLVFISKSVKLNYYVREWFKNPEVGKEVNDVAVLNYFRNTLKLPLEPHIIDPIVVGKDELPPPLNRREFDVSGLIPMTVTYASLSYGGPYYQVSIPGVKEVDEVRRILSTVMKYSSNGYPEPLRIAHIKSKLKNSELTPVMQKLGYGNIFSGREVLGEFT